MVEGYFRERFKDEKGKNKINIHYSENSIGYWRNNEYKRHSVGEIEGFCGWSKLKQICDSGKGIRAQSFPAFILRTGERISEFLHLKLTHFAYSSACTEHESG